ncbi:small multi-drug export protein [Patescibacteria group bacterium]|nr:small multi-drug export protein [Patescibacteria group bacterium]MBU1759142.1 small multi-drug export protein [Patescibacteria group bacterium]MBU1907497.1 small multi-drug export protein [Patescibacteria group bacterium]
MSNIINWLANFPPEVATLLLAMLPIGELRASIPVGIEVFNLRPIVSFIVSIIGNAIPMFVIVYGIEAVTKWAAKNWIWAHRLLEHFYERTERVTREKYQKYGAVALFLLTAIPLPLTGVWTASLATVVFRVPHRKAFPAILLGMIVAGIIVSALTLGTEGLLKTMF